MRNPRKLSSMARKWRKFRARNAHFAVATKGHFVVYTCDEERYEIPLEYLKSDEFEELLRASEEEFGLPANGPITLHCDGRFLENVVSVVRGDTTEELEKAQVPLMTACRKSTLCCLSLEQSSCRRLVSVIESIKP